MANNYTVGLKNQNFIIETAGKFYVKVAERFYEIDFRESKLKELEKRVAKLEEKLNNA